MRKFLLVLALFASSCTRTDDLEPAFADTATRSDLVPLPDRPVGFAINYNVTADEILSNALLIEDRNEVKSIEPLWFEGTHPAYVVQYADGWKLFSSDKRTPALLAHSDNGTFSLDEMDPPARAGSKRC